MAWIGQYYCGAIEARDALITPYQAVPIRKQAPFAALQLSAEMLAAVTNSAVTVGGVVASKPMSALGQKRTLHPEIAMSALPPIADISG